MGRQTNQIYSCRSQKTNIRKAAEKLFITPVCLKARPLLKSGTGLGTPLVPAPKQVVPDRCRAHLCEEGQKMDADQKDTFIIQFYDSFLLRKGLLNIGLAPDAGLICSPPSTGASPLHAKPHHTASGNAGSPRRAAILLPPEIWDVGFQVPFQIRLAEKPV